ncbi:MAG: hypothetical protein GY913_33665 [Proteobacteria bacterium]|nr:hypothetical protein [Pseudomonadota bacterium]MCP4921876.1 hypothetical protein [Pseudomonadota bacterium]
MWLALSGLTLAADVVVLRSDSVAAYDVPTLEVVESLQGAGRTVRVIDIRGERDLADAAVVELSREAPSAIVAFGAKAAYAAHEGVPEVPLVYAMVRQPERYGISGGLITGVSQEVEPAELMAQLHLFTPDVHRIGMILSTENSGAHVSTAMEAAEAASFQLKVLRVHGERDVRGAYLNMRDDIDAVWLVPDSEVITPENFRFLREEALRHQKPIIASSEVLVQAGALMCVAPDYAQVGRQAADLALRISEGESPVDLPVESPASVRVVLNRASMERLGLDVDPMLLDFVDEVVDDDGGR